VGTALGLTLGAKSEGGGAMVSRGYQDGRNAEGAAAVTQLMLVFIAANNRFSDDPRPHDLESGQVGQEDKPQRWLSG
jgi:hypothetical protein